MVKALAKTAQFPHCRPDDDVSAGDLRKVPGALRDAQALEIVLEAFFPVSSLRLHAP